MRGLEESLARIARRDQLRERANSGRAGSHRVERPASEPAPERVAEPDPTAPAAPSVSPVVDEVTAALQSVVRRNPGVFATVVVQEADTAWSVWIGEWDGTLRTRVTRLEPDPPAAPAVESRPTVDAAPEPDPDLHGDTIAFAVPRPVAPPAPSARPAMNDRVAGRIAEMLRREAARESRGVDA